MPSYTRETAIHRPVEAVFAFCSDLRNELAWNPDAQVVEALTDGPVGPETRFRARWRGAPESIVEIVAYDPPRSWETRSRTLGMDARTRGLVEQDADGSRYRIHVELRARGARRLLAALAIRLMARQEDRNMARIRRALEHGGTA